MEFVPQIAHSDTKKNRNSRAFAELRKGWATTQSCQPALSRKLMPHRRRHVIWEPRNREAEPDNGRHTSCWRMILKKSLVGVLLLLCAVIALAPARSFAQEASSAGLDTAIISQFLFADVAPAPPAPAIDSLPVSPAAPIPAPASPEGPRRFGVGVKVSLLGIGGEAAVALTKRINVRGGGNFFNYSHTFDKDGVSYAGQIAFRSGEAHLDLFPFAGGFHVSPGLLFYNGNNVNAAATVGAGQTFTLGGVTYSSSAANPVSGTAKLDFNKAAPLVTIGFGNLIPRNRRRFSFTTEFGVAYTGAPKASLALQGTACTVPAAICVNAGTDPTVQSNIASEVAKVNHDVSAVKIWPVASFGFGVNF